MLPTLRKMIFVSFVQQEKKTSIYFDVYIVYFCVVLPTK